MIRWGILSTARIADRVVTGARLAENAEIVAVGSRDLSRAQAYASERGIARAHGSYDDLLRNDTARDVAFRQGMCDRSIFMIPTALKRNHVSAAHTDADIDRTLDVAREVLAGLS